jgi:glucose/arabinose dehydrogenase
VPADNPFTQTPGARPEIWALGLRNPWRFSFDSAGNLYIGDVGQATHEEIDRVPAGSPGGVNFGWHCTEGFLARDLAGCPLDPEEDYVAPVVDFTRVEIMSIVGGYVYEGSRYPKLRGGYVFGGFIASSLWLLPAGSAKPISYWETGLLNPSTFGEDIDGELYVASFTEGKLFQVGIE